MSQYNTILLYIYYSHQIQVMQWQCLCEMLFIFYSMKWQCQCNYDYYVCLYYDVWNITANNGCLQCILMSIIK